MNLDGVLTALRIVAVVLGIIGAGIWIMVAWQSYAVMTDEAALDDWRAIARTFADSVGDIQIVVSNQTDVQMCNGTVLALATTNTLDNSTKVYAQQPSPMIAKVISDK